jgi:hypothetical protein
MSNYQNYPQQQSAPAPAPVIHNPFKPGRPALPFRTADDKQVAQQQSIYSGSNKDYLKLTNRAKWSNIEPTSQTKSVNKSQPALVNGKVKAAKPVDRKLTVVREGGGQVWDDQTLLEWDPSHFRLFVGDLAGEVTDDTLFKAFSKYPTLVKARVLRDKKTTKSRGYGFVSFSSPDDFLKSWKEMNGKYIGTHPIKLRKATTELKPKVVTERGMEAKKRFSPYEIAKSAGEGKDWKDLKRKERKHNRLIGLHRVGNNP